MSRSDGMVLSSMYVPSGLDSGRSYEGTYGVTVLCGMQGQVIQGRLPSLGVEVKWSRLFCASSMNWDSVSEMEAALEVDCLIADFPSSSLSTSLLTSAMSLSSDSLDSSRSSMGSELHPVVYRNSIIVYFIDERALPSSKRDRTLRQSST